MYSEPKRPPPSRRLVGITIAALATSAAVYATTLSYGGFGRPLPKPIDFRSSMTSEGAGGAEPETIMVPDTSIPAAQMSDETTPNLVREGEDKHIQTLLPAADSSAAAPGWTFGRKPQFDSKSGPGVFQPTLKTSARAGFPQLSLTARETGVTTMSYCVTTGGRVRDAKVSVSSGYNRLDAAAVDWLIAREYAPGTIKSKPAEMCGLIDYQWRLGGK